MNSLELINEMKETKTKINNFKIKAKKYPISHNYYKEKLKSLKLELRGFLIKLKKSSQKSEALTGIDSILSTFLKLEKPSTKDCEKLIDKMDITIQDLELLSTEEDLLEERIYDEKTRFNFRSDLKSIFDKSNKNIFVVDSWINEDLLEIYLNKIKRNIKIKVLSGKNPKGKIVKLINDFNNQYNFLEVRESPKIHDRAVFIDSKHGWVMGQSIKDAAKNKPTYLIKLKDSKKLEYIYYKIYLNSKKLK